jgi:hypothetical protein
MNVFAGSGTLMILRQGDGALIESFSASSLAINDSTVTIDPSDFTPGTAYYVIFNSSCFRSAGGLWHPGIAADYGWNFSTAGGSSPIAMSLSPLDGMSNVDPSTSIAITFDEPVKAGDGYLHVVDLDTGEVVDYIHPSEGVYSNNQVSFLPDLDAGGFYAIKIPTGVFYNYVGQSFGGISDTTTWNFSTMGVSPPIVVSLDPADNATGVSTGTMLQIEFSQKVGTQSGTIYLRRQGDDAVIASWGSSSPSMMLDYGTVTLMAPTLDASNGYYVQIPAGFFVNLGGMSYSGMASPGDWNFVTQ